MEHIYGKTKPLALEIKSFNEEGIIDGYAAAFNNIDFGDDKIIPGAFKRTLKANKGKVPMLMDHKWDFPMGVNLEAKEDSRGLLVKGQVNLKIQYARERYEYAKQLLGNDMQPGLSIGYAAVNWEFDEDKETGQRYRKLKELKLVEYSMVVFPMNDKATITSAKSLDELFNEEVSETELMEKFVAKLKEKGFNDSNIKAALERSAAKFETPSLRHVFEDSLKNLKLK